MVLTPTQGNLCKTKTMSVLSNVSVLRSKKAVEEHTAAAFTTSRALRYPSLRYRARYILPIFDFGSKRPPSGAASSVESTLPAKRPPLHLVMRFPPKRNFSNLTHTNGLYITSRKPFFRQQGSSSVSISRVIALYILV